MQTLKPCPFCGSSNVKLFEYPFGYDGDEPDFVQCQDCSSDGPYGTKAGAAEKWNARITLPEAASAFTTRELAQEMLRQFDRDIPNTVVHMLRVVLGRFVETGEYIDDIGMLIGKQPTPPLGVQRWERYAKELQEKLAEAQAAEGGS